MSGFCPFERTTLFVNWAVKLGETMLRGLRVLLCALFWDVDPKKASYWEGETAKMSLDLHQ